MMTIGGKEVFTELEEVVDPAHSVLLVIDMQNDFLLDEGKAVAAGYSIDMNKKMLPQLARLIDSARRNGVLVIYTEHKYLPEWQSVSPAYIRFLSKRFGWPPNKHWLVAGSHGAQTVDAIKPQSKDLVIEKWRSSSFSDTNLDMLLRSNEKKTVIITGIVTQGCVESTARDTFFHDYYSVLVEDCVSGDNPELHEGTLRAMRTRVDVVTSEDVMNIWDKAGKAKAA